MPDSSVVYGGGLMLAGCLFSANADVQVYSWGRI